MLLSIGSPPPANSDFNSAKAAFPELNLAVNTPFRQRSQHVTQAMVENPNSVLQVALAGQTITHRTFIQISTTDQPVKGGGTANTAFLADACNRLKTLRAGLASKHMCRDSTR